ncbi:MAG TPA: hypothetical protein VGE76_07360 [Opitutaceae bacterium]
MGKTGALSASDHGIEKGRRRAQQNRRPMRSCSGAVPLEGEEESAKVGASGAQLCDDGFDFAPSAPAIDASRNALFELRQLSRPTCVGLGKLGDAARGHVARAFQPGGKTRPRAFIPCELTPEPAPERRRRATQVYEKCRGRRLVRLGQQLPHERVFVSFRSHGVTMPRMR